MSDRDPREAERLFEDAWQRGRSGAGPTAMRTVRALLGLADLLRREQRWEELDVILDESLNECREARGHADVMTLEVLETLVKVRLEQGRLEQAAELAGELLEATPQDSVKRSGRQALLELTRS